MAAWSKAAFGLGTFLRKIVRRLQTSSISTKNKERV
jgi:hypothetical protein